MMAQYDKARAVGINHVALVVGDIEGALEFYGRIFEITLRGRNEGMAFIDLGDQFIALTQGETGGTDEKRHFGLVVDSADTVRDRLHDAAIEIIPGFGLNFLDPWGNRFQIIEYHNIQFTKAPHILRGMGMSDLQKSEEALSQLADKGMSPES